MKLAKVLHFGGIALRGAETWTLRNVDQRYMDSSEMWCWRRMEKTIWAYLVRNELEECPAYNETKEG